MTAVLILATIFTFIIAVTYISEKEKTKRQKMKINAAKEKKAQEAKENDFVDAESQEEDPEK